MPHHHHHPPPLLQIQAQREGSRKTNEQVLADSISHSAGCSYTTSEDVCAECGDFKIHSDICERPAAVWRNREPSLQLRCNDPAAVTCNESPALSITSAQLDKTLCFQRICPIATNTAAASSPLPALFSFCCSLIKQSHPSPSSDRAH